MAFSLKKTLKRSYTARFVVWLLLLNWVDLLVVLLPIHRTVKSRKRVIFLKTDGLGDHIIWSATFVALEELYPQDEFEKILIATTKLVEIGRAEHLFEGHVFFNWERFVIDPLYRFRAMREMRRLDADILVNTRLTREFLWSDSIVRCSGAAERIGSRGIDNQMTALQDQIARSWYTKLAPAPVRSDHELISHKKFLDSLHPHKRNVLTLPKLGIVSALPVQAPRPDYAVFFLGASSPRRVFPIKRSVAVAEHVRGKYALEIILCGGPGEEKLGSAFRRDFSDKATDLIGKTSLGELAHILAGAKLVVANDTGAAHFATAAKTPTVVLTPGSDVGRFFPYPEKPETREMRQRSVLHEMPCFGCVWDCIYTDLADNEPWPCIGNIGVDDVLSTIEHLLGDSAMPERPADG
ncbi:MAG: glycosyltransferase family 9 protein [Pyrinomonadaceae bacterium]